MTASTLCLQSVLVISQKEVKNCILLSFKSINLCRIYKVLKFADDVVKALLLEEEWQITMEM